MGQYRAQYLIPPQLVDLPWPGSAGENISEEHSVVVNSTWRHTSPQVLRGSSEAGVDARYYTDWITRGF